MSSATAPGRPRSFDVDEALRRAMQAFWSDGFARTSYESLEAATRLRRQSLIYAFGDKRTMFRKALALYARERVGEIEAMLERPGRPLDNVQAVFASWLGDVAHGCLMVNTLGELGRADPEAADAVLTATQRLRRAFAKVFARARAEGDLRADLDPEALASLAVAAGDGALLHARASGDGAQAVRAFAGLLALLAPSGREK